MRRVVALGIDQLYRPQPGGIGTYVRGLLEGLGELAAERELDLVALAPRGPRPEGLADSLTLAQAPFTVAALTRLWWDWPVAVPRQASVVHATTLAGPSRGARGARHSVALHDLLWRDEPNASTARGRRFHERRLGRLLGREELTIIATSPTLVARLADLGVQPSRLHFARLGVDRSPAAPVERVRAELARAGVEGPYTLYVGTREPRKNLARLIEAHRRARAEEAGLGPLVLVGPAGWGAVDTADAVVLGSVERSLLHGLVGAAAVCAYVPVAEGWGLPPVEALARGTAVVASETTPSVAGREGVELAAPLEVDSIAGALVRAARAPGDVAARAARVSAVADLTWRQCALDHLAAWA